METNLVNLIDITAMKANVGKYLEAFEVA